MLTKYKKIELFLGLSFLVFATWMFFDYRQLKKENTALRAKEQESQNIIQKVPTPQETPSDIKKIALEEEDYFYDSKKQESTTTQKKETDESDSLPLPPPDYEKTRLTQSYADSLEEENDTKDENNKVDKDEDTDSATTNTETTASSNKETQTDVPTEKTNPDAFSFVVIGDSENYKNYSGYNPELVTIMEEAQELKPDFAIFAGDIITASEDSKLTNERKIKELKEVIDENFKKYFLVLGKHDLECGDFCVDTWREVFWGQEKPEDDEDRILYHSFDYRNTHFVLLSNDYPIRRSMDADQIKWLEKDLKKTTKEHKIVIMHVPPITFFEQSAQDCHDMSCEEEVQKEVLAIFKDNDVDLVVSGHEHTFEHKEEGEIDFVLAGNSGNSDRYEGALEGDFFSLFKIKGKKIELQAFTKEGRVVTEIEIK